MESNFNITKGMTSRYEKTLSFIKKNIPDKKRVLDLGVPNPFSDLMKRRDGKSWLQRNGQLL